MESKKRIFKLNTLLPTWLRGFPTWSPSRVAMINVVEPGGNYFRGVKPHPHSGGLGAIKTPPTLKNL